MESALTGTAALVTGASSGRRHRPSARRARCLRRAGCPPPGPSAGPRREHRQGGRHRAGRGSGHHRPHPGRGGRTAGRRAIRTAGHPGQQRRPDAAGHRPRRGRRGVGPHDRHQCPGPALHHPRRPSPILLQAEQGPRRVANIVNISSIAGRVAWNGYGVYNLTKFGVNGFTESLRQEVTQRHVRVSVVEPGGVATELGSHNTPEVRNEMIDPFYQQTEVLTPEDIADGVAYMVTRPATPPSASCGSCPPNSSDRIRRPPTSCAPRKTNGSTASFDEQRRLGLTRAIGSPPRPARPVPIDSSTKSGAHRADCYSRADPHQCGTVGRAESIVAMRDALTFAVRDINRVGMTGTAARWVLRRACQPERVSWSDRTWGCSDQQRSAKPQVAGSH